MVHARWCTSTFSIAVLNHLCAAYPGRWIKRRGLAGWPPYFSDHSPLDFFWGPQTPLVYEKALAEMDYLTTW
ncbi:hypothetical protein TNCV_2597371 [Trichonephila clavipes]|nr:hypothetical protein TNCV_2597371 [Trichonephila clavipes]